MSLFKIHLGIKVENGFASSAFVVVIRIDRMFRLIGNMSRSRFLFWWFHWKFWLYLSHLKKKFTGVEISEFSLLPKRDIKKRGSSIIKVLKAERVERRGELLLKSNLTCGLWCTFDELSLFIAQLHHQYQAHHNRQVSLLQEKKTGCTGGKKEFPHQSSW